MLFQFTNFIMKTENKEQESNIEKKSEDKNTSLEKLAIGILIAVVFIVLFNAYQISALTKNKSDSGIAITGNVVKQTAKPTVDIIPKGVPNIYGKELGISFDDVSALNQQKADQTIKIVGVLDTKISLQGEDLNRYISIVSKISCEYCCGAESIIFKNGEPSCGCAHSFAMRGLAKYLIKNHPKEFTDEQILEELGKWKVLFFPTQMTQKAQVLKSQGIELNYINIASNKYQGIEKQAGSQGAMVGGC